jgi:hypothetical protein
MRFFHGGVPGFQPGDLLLPPQATGVERTLTAVAQEMGASADHARRDVVYVTSGREVARVYAALTPDGGLYEVVPEGPLGEDPDCTLAGVSFTCRYAVVVRVVDPVVLFRDRPVEAWMRKLNRASEQAHAEWVR